LEAAAIPLESPAHPVGLRKNPPPMRHGLTRTESRQTSSSGNPGTLSCTDLKSAQSFSTFDASQVRRSGERGQPKLESNLDYSRDWWIGDPTAFLLDLRGVTNCSEFTRILAVEQERRERYGTSRWRQKSGFDGRFGWSERITNRQTAVIHA